MNKIFSIITLLFLSTCLFAADIVNMKLGDFDVTAITIQYMNHKDSLFRYYGDKDIEDFLKQDGATASAINVFYVNTGDHKILFDTGINTEVLLKQLKSIKVDPKDIDIICITHMHFDHIAGLVNNAQKTFPNADIYISEEELMANRNSQILPICSDKIKSFAQNEQILPYIKTVPAFGHTDGHTMFEITSKGKKMLVWGDIIHAPIQFQDPNIYLTYDTDFEKALAVRTHLLYDYADTSEYIAGAHLLNCGIGQIQRNKNGFKFIPVQIFQKH
ncbi:MAG: MBL fold metallo-hydrolase [Elusimicrobia bacterium]|nr:MBL fold metallo-hydrolase [Elusimicrobiota bacterium]